MLAQTLFFWLLLLLCLLPLLLAGITILRKITDLNRIELMLPVGSILGLTIFTFFLNAIAFLVRGYAGVVIAYLLTIFLGILLNKFIKADSAKIIFLTGKQLFFWIFSIVFWGGFIFWKTAHVLIGSDTNLYYAVAHSFIRGNFPPMTPWQPDLPLFYHLGTSELLGALHFFSNLDFQFLHLFLSALFIFCAAQIVIWITGRHTNLVNFLLANLAVAVTFISFGFIYLTWPVFPIKLPSISSINQLIIWLRNLPTVNQSIEVYGAPINLDALIYFIFHAFGIAIFLSLVVLLLNYKKEKPLAGWVVICIGLASLALVNESLFVAAFPAIVLGIVLVEYRAKTIFKNIKVLLSLLILTASVVFLQGGIISASINTPNGIEKSAIIFPKKEDIKENFNGYHSGQEMSKLLSLEAGLPLRWFHIGINLLLLLCISAAFIIKANFTHPVLLKVFFMAGLASLVGYNVIVPKFLVANGNRFLSVSFLFFSLVLYWSLIPIYEKIKKRLYIRIIFLVIVGWIFIPTILPPLALLSKTRFGENKLIPKLLQSSQGILWLKNNTTLGDRVMVLDKNAPHPSGQERALVEAGVFAPVFPGDFRAFTIEASPQYIDIAYSLSPRALQKLKINILLIDKVFYETLPEKRKKQLEDKNFFVKLFDDSNDLLNWEKIYKVKDEYINKGR
ncbi:MAG: hypothetical protein Q8P65_00945, partial [bacterium]|nr:hypothetical protein [bacterium]